MTEFEFLISSRTHLCRWLLRIPQTHETRACKEVCEKVAIATGGRRREADASRPSGFSRRLHKTECRRLLHCRDAAFVGSDSRAPTIDHPLSQRYQQGLLLPETHHVWFEARAQRCVERGKRRRGDLFVCRKRCAGA